MTKSDFLERIKWEAQSIAGLVGLILAMPLIFIGYIVCRVSEERTIRALAADANMTVAEYLEAEWQRDEYAVSKLFK